jgi:hypothetical protein
MRPRKGGVRVVNRGCRQELRRVGARGRTWVLGSAKRREVGPCRSKGHRVICCDLSSPNEGNWPCQIAVDCVEVEREESILGHRSRFGKPKGAVSRGASRTTPASIWYYVGPRWFDSPLIWHQTAATHKGLISHENHDVSFSPPDEKRGIAMRTQISVGGLARSGNCSIALGVVASLSKVRCQRPFLARSENISSLFLFLSLIVSPLCNAVRNGIFASCMGLPAFRAGGRFSFAP